MFLAVLKVTVDVPAIEYTRHAQNVAGNGSHPAPGLSLRELVSCPVRGSGSVVEPSRRRQDQCGGPCTLATVTDDATVIYIDADTRMHILSVPTRNSALLSLTIIPLYTDFEEKFMKLVWRVCAKSASAAAWTKKPPSLLAAATVLAEREKTAPKTGDGGVSAGGEREKRINFYADHNLGWVARPPRSNQADGFKRAGRFKKVSYEIRAGA
ncbi:hypothetical protein BDZ89DRAFT_1135392 [Hymenopellis radicata]|nr:hypothetical protein BDZ89DRAFT_1135392 [Hymenopellis radicata]